MNTSIDRLMLEGFVVLPYPQDLRVAVNETAGSWKKFCSLPSEVKEGFLYSNNSDGVGYELKKGEGNKADHKENFDVSLTGKDWLDKHIGNIKDPVALEFVQNAISLTGLLKPTVLYFAKQVQDTYGLAGFVDKVNAGKVVSFIRCIHYFNEDEVGIETATAHVDQSAFTFHLFESAPGLQCLTYDGRWIDMPVSEGGTVAIPTMQLQLWSKGQLRALCHRVISTPETAKNGRYSMVVFFQITDMPKYDKETHGRLQEKKPGFNYKMSDEEFSKLFKK